MISSVLTDLLGTTLDDIYVASFLDDEESPWRVRLHLRVMYLELKGQFLELRCVEDTGTMSLSLVASMRGLGEPDEDFRPSLSSLRELVLIDPVAENQVDAFVLWGAEFEGESVSCNAAQLNLANGQVLFIDPTYHFGIRLGGPEQRDCWYRNWPEAGSLPEWRTSRTSAKQ